MIGTNKVREESLESSSNDYGNKFILSLTKINRPKVLEVRCIEVFWDQAQVGGIGLGVNGAPLKSVHTELSDSLFHNVPVFLVHEGVNTI